MNLQLIGPHPFERDDQGLQKVRIGTLFLGHNALYTLPPGVHAWQRSSFIESINRQRAGNRLGPLGLDEEEQICSNSVDLIADGIGVRGR
jgi:hypothetical protein